MAGMDTARVKGTANLAGLQHAEDNDFISFYSSIATSSKSAKGKIGIITILSYMKSVAVTTGVVSIAVTVSATGFQSYVGGTNNFVVPGPEFGSGISFVIVSSLIGLFAFYKSRQSSAI